MTHTTLPSSTAVAAYVGGSAVVLAAMCVAHTGVLTTVPQDEGGYVFGAQAIRAVGVVQYLRDIDLPGRVR